MPKRQTGGTEAKISRYIKEDRGKVNVLFTRLGLQFKMYLPSGRVHRTIGWKTEREYYLLSFNYLYICDWADDVIDIREQFPLDREETFQIAEELEIQHPKDFKTSTSIVMIKDSLLSVREGNNLVCTVRTLKLAEDLK